MLSPWALWVASWAQYRFWNAAGEHSNMACTFWAAFDVFKPLARFWALFLVPLDFQGVHNPEF